MDENVKSIASTIRIVSLLKCLLASYTVTGLCLLIMAILLYKFSISEKIIDISIIVIYCISSFTAGMLFSRKAPKRRFLWGFAAGMAYFLIICLISVCVEPDFQPLSNACLTTLGICAGSGMLGGIVG
ncbi:MAG: TIGR04086 family membrane protein [Lachnospiraceae bacterium]|nr:TIGR04086 family membrane protein [Lachnospiraceae bacterium]